MATKLWLRATTWDTNRYTLSHRLSGTSTSTFTVNTAASGTNIQWTDSAGGNVVEWCSDPLTVATTVAGAVTFNVWCQESNMSANTGARARLYKVSNDRATWTEMGGGPFDKGTEISPTARQVQNWTGTPTTNNALAVGDRIGVRFYITNAGGTMANGYTVVLDHDGPTPAATGDSYISLSEDTYFALTEALKVADTVTAARQLGEAIGPETAKVADTVTTTMPLVATATEALRLSEELTAERGVTPPLEPSPAPGEALGVDDGGFSSWALLGVLRLSDTVEAALASIDAAPAAEALTLGDTDVSVTRLDMGALAASPTPAEALGVADSVTVDPLVVLELAPSPTPAEALAVDDSGVSSWALLGTLRLSDTVEAVLTPLEGSATETFLLADQQPPVAQVEGEGLDLTRTVDPEALAIADSGVSSWALLGTLRITDTVEAEMGAPGAPGDVNLTESLTLSESGTIAVSRPETIQIADTLTVVLVPLRVDATETVVLSEAATVKLEVLEGLPATDMLRVADSLAATLHPLELAPSEALTLSAPLASVLHPLESADLVGEALTLAATATVICDLGVVLAETLGLAETRDELLVPLEATPQEVLDLWDGLGAIPGATLSTGELLEPVRLSDAVAATLTPLAAAPADEGLRVGDEPPAGLFDVGAQVTDTLRVADEAPSAELNPLIPDPGGDRTVAVPPEGLRVGDVVEATLHPLVASPAESVRITEVIYSTRIDPTGILVARQTWTVARRQEWIVEYAQEWEVD